MGHAAGRARPDGIHRPAGQSLEKLREQDKGLLSRPRLEFLKETAESESQNGERPIANVKEILKDDAVVQGPPMSYFASRKNALSRSETRLNCCAYCSETRLRRISMSGLTLGYPSRSTAQPPPR